LSAIKIKKLKWFNKNDNKMYILNCSFFIHTEFEGMAKSALEELKKVLNLDFIILFFEKNRTFDYGFDVTIEIDIDFQNFSTAVLKTLNMCFLIADKWNTNYRIFSYEPELSLVASEQTLAKFYIKYIRWANFELNIKIDYDQLPIKLEDKVKVFENDETLKEGINNLIGKINSYPQKGDYDLWYFSVFFEEKGECYWLSENDVEFLEK
jgi:hypothetical protein